MTNRSKKYMPLKFLESPISGLRYLLLVVGLIFSGFVILAIPELVAPVSPMISLIMAWIWIILPGILLSFMIADGISWLERIPVSFVLGVGLASFYTIIAIIFRLTLNQLLGFSISLFILVAIIYLIYLSLQESDREFADLTVSSESRSRPQVTFLLLLLLAASLASYLIYQSSQWPAAGDDLAALPHFGEVISQGRITGTEPFHGSGTPLTPRNELIAWGYLNVLAIKITNIQLDAFFANLRPILTFLALTALYTLLRQLFKKSHLVFFLLGLWLLYLLATRELDGLGNDFVTRIAQDKFVGWFIFAPIILVFMLWYLERRKGRYLLCLGLGAFGIAILHPVAYVQLLILAGGFGFVYLVLERSKFAFEGLIKVGLIFSSCLIVPIIQYLRFTGEMPVDRAGLSDAVELGRITMAVSRYRLWLMDGERYIVHPSTILTPIIILGAFMAILLFLRKYSNNASRLIIATLIILPIFLYVPPIADLTGKVVTPFLMWRLAWPLPLFAILAIGWATWLIMEWLFQRIANLKTERTMGYQSLGAILLLITVLFIAWPQILASQVNIEERISENDFSSCVIAKPVIQHLNTLASDNRSANVMASKSLNFCIPGIAPNANVIEFRGFGTVNRFPGNSIADSIRRVEDAEYFGSARWVDKRILESLERYDIDYLLMERDRQDFELQLNHLPEMFELVFQDLYFSLYATKDLTASGILLAGLTALSNQNWDEAEQIFSEILEEEPDQLLAVIGIGQAYEGLGEPDIALDFYQEAAKLAVDEAAIHARLASLSLLLNDFEMSVREYQQAIALAPQRSSLFYSLGQIQFFLGDEQAAKANFESGASLEAPSGTASYYSAIGRAVQLAGWDAGAIEYYQKAIDIEPSAIRYVLMAQAFEGIGEVSSAIESYQKASELDPWHYLPHLGLGFLFQEMGENGKAIEEFKVARQLNPTKTTTFVLLGQEIGASKGVDVAIEDMQRFADVNRFLPGPHRALAALYISNDNLEFALEELDYSTHLRPNDGTVFAAKGHLLLANDQLEEARTAFEQALSKNPDMVSARLGLSLLHTRNLEYGFDTGQLLQVAHLEPTNPGLRLTLADAYRRQGKWEKAQDDIEWLLQIDPTNVEALSALGDLQGSRTDWDEAILNYRRALELEPNNPNVILGLGTLYQELADYESAEELFTQALQFSESKLVAQIRLAELYQSTGRFDDAIAIIESAGQENPGSAAALLAQANLFRQQGQLENALSIYDRLLADQTTHTASQIAVAQIESELASDLNTAISRFYTTVEANPASSSAILAASQFLKSLGMLTEAEALIRDSLLLHDVTPKNYQELSEILWLQGNWEMALDTIQAGVQRFPMDSSALSSAGNYLVSRGDYIDATEYFERAIQLDPAFIPAYTSLYNLANRRGDSENAQQIIERALANAPGSADAHVLASKYLSSQGRWEEAEAAARTSLTRQGVTPEVYLILSELQRQQGKWDQALETLEASVQRFPAEADPYSYIGKYYLESGNFSNAAEFFEKALKIEPTFEPAFEGLYRLAHYQGDSESMRLAIEQAINNDPGSAGAYLLASRYLLSQGYLERAQDAAYSSLTRQGVSPENYLLLSEIQRRQGRWTAALDTLESSIERFPSVANTYHNVGNFLVTRGELGRASEYFEKAIDHDPTFIPSYASLSELARNQNDSENAWQILDGAISRNPDSSEAYVAMASYYESQDEYEKAESYLRQALALAPNDIETHRSLGHFYERHNQLAEAAEIFQKAFSIPSSSSQPSIDLGEVYLANGQFDEAFDIYQKAMQSDRGNPDLYLAIARYYSLLGQSNDALMALIEAITIAPGYVDSYLSLSEHYQGLGHLEEAMSLLEQAISLDQSNLLALSSLAELHHQYGNYDKAIALLYGAVESAPTDLASYLALARIYQYHGKTAEAEEMLTEGVRNSLDKQGALLTRAAFYSDLGNWDLGEEDYNAVVRTGNYTLGSGLEAAAYFQQRNNSEKALKILDSLEERFDDGRVPTEMAKIYASKADWSAAISAYEQAIELGTDNAAPFIGLAKVYELQGNMLEALIIFEQAAMQFPNDPNVFNALGDAYLDRLDFDKARDAYERALDLDSTNANAASNLDIVFQIMGERRLDLIPIIDRAEAAPSAATYLILGNLYQQRGEWNVAWSWYRKAVDIDPYNADVWLAIAKLHLTFHEWNEAVEALENGLDLDPNSAPLLLALGYVQEKLEITDSAKRTYEELIAANPLYIEGYLASARLWTEMGQTDSAVATIQQGIDTNPADQRGYMALGDLLFEMGRFDDAQDAYESGLAKIPGSADLIVAIGDLQSANIAAVKEEYESAKARVLSAEYRIWTIENLQASAQTRAEQRVTELKLVDARESLVSEQESLNSVQRKYQNAAANLAIVAQYYETALKIQPDNAEAILGLAQLDFIADSPEEALSHILAASAIHPNSIPVLSHLGYAYLDDNQIDNAIQSFQHLSQIDPLNPLATIGLVEAYQNLDQLTVVQAGTIAERTQENWEYIINYYRWQQSSDDDAPAG